MQLKEYLMQTAAQIHALEAKKKQAIAADNKQQYLDCVREKAAILSNLYENAQKQDVSAVTNAKNILAALHGFSNSAKQALAVNSPWFMSELLYPEDYQENEPNNLDKLIENL
jgi:small-conductance mechanosensitive channel